MISKLEADAYLHLAKDKHTGAKFSHIFPVIKGTFLSAIAAEQIRRVCIYIDCGSKDTAYIGLFPNHYEKDWSKFMIWCGDAMNKTTVY